VQISDCKEEEEEEEEEEEAKHFSIQTLISSEIQVVIFCQVSEQAGFLNPRI